MVTVTGQVIDATYRVQDEEPVIRLFCRGEDGVFVAEDHDFDPYFYVIPEENNDEDATELAAAIREDGLVDSDGRLDTVRVVDRMVDGEERRVLQVVGVVPADIPKLRETVLDTFTVAETREFDIPFYRRYLLDKDLTPLKPVQFTGELGETGETPVLQIDRITHDPGEETGTENLAAFDIEVHNDEIIMASIRSDDREHVVTSAAFSTDADWLTIVENEEALLQHVKTLLQDVNPDVLVTYNGDGYDLPRLRERGRVHGIAFDIGIENDGITFERGGRNSAGHIFGVLHFDVYRYVNKILGQYMDSESLTLGNVAAELLNREKKDLDWEDIRTAWQQQEDIDLLAEYALRDAALTYDLGIMLYPQLTSLCQVTGMLPFPASRSSYGRLVETFLMRQAVNQHRVIPNRPTDNEYGKRRRNSGFSGGYVYEPDEGLYEDLAVFDYSSLYPSIIVSHNIGPDTVDCNCCSEPVADTLDYTFCSKDTGFIPELLQELLTERATIKDRLASLDEDSQQYRDLDYTQFAYKTLLNSSYGYYAFAGARWYCRSCAEATAALGRHYIQDAMDIAEEHGLDVVYGDTDSAILTHPQIREKAPAYIEEVNKELPQFMELELEGFFTRGLFTAKDSGQGAKKRYALRREDGTVKITGFEQVRRDWSPVAKQTQETVINHVLQGEVAEAVDAANTVIEHIRNEELPLKQFIIYTQLTKSPDKYESTSPHVEAAKKAKRNGYDITPGQTIRYVITPGAGSISDRARIVEEANRYDSTYYIENQVVPAALRILKTFDYTAADLLEKGTQTGLDAFT